MNSASHDSSEPRRAALVRTAQALLESKKRGRHIDLGFESFADYAASLGYPTPQSRDLLELGRVLSGLPGVVPLVERGDVSPEAARALAPVVADPKVMRLPPGAADPLPIPEAATRWIEAASRLALTSLEDEVETAVERVRVWPRPVSKMEFELDRVGLADFERARALASQMYERPIGKAELIEIVTRHYLDRHDH